MVALGIPIERAAKVLGIAEHTLRKHFASELVTARDDLHRRLAESLFTKAFGNGPAAVAANIFALKSMYGWREASRIEHTGADGGTIRFETLTPEQITNLSDAQLDALMRRARQALGAHGTGTGDSNGG
jgi:hypothetical protein